jgi:hypothetical protein
LQAPPRRMVPALARNGASVWTTVHTRRGRRNRFLSARGNHPSPMAPAPLPADPLALLLAAVLDPSAARPSGRLRPLVVGWPHPVVRLPRRRRAGLVAPTGLQQQHGETFPGIDESCAMGCSVHRPGSYLPSSPPPSRPLQTGFRYPFESLLSL